MSLTRKVKNKVLVYGNYRLWKTPILRWTEHRDFAGKKIQITDCTALTPPLDNIGHQLGVLHLDDCIDGYQHLSDIHDLWTHFSPECLGTCMIIDSCCQKSIEGAKNFIAHIKSHDEDHPIAIGATEQYLPQANSMKNLSLKLGLKYEPLLDFDPRHKKSVRLLALSLFSEVVYYDVYRFCVLKNDFFLE
ncbi:MAG: hypothetical protein Q9M28_03640 [Mariprofundaceae bacterium]|nr:hypothetical protein [Mariprofundaceae bacterium]